MAKRQLSDSLRAKVISLLEVKQFKHAEQLLKTELSNDPENDDALGFLGLLNFHRKDFPSAEHNIKQALKLESEDHRYHFIYSLILRSTQRLKQAETEVLEAMRLYPNYPAYLAHYGYSLYNLKEFEKAKSVARSALSIQPDNGDALNVMGIINLEQEQWEQAQMYFEQSIRVDCHSVEGHIGMAYCLINQNRINEAHESAKMIVQNYPESKDAQRVYLKTLWLKNTAIWMFMKFTVWIKNLSRFQYSLLLISLVVLEHIALNIANSYQLFSTDNHITNIVSNLTYIMFVTLFIYMIIARVLFTHILGKKKNPNKQIVI